jgi:Flp pilus assembly protein protease CpaA
MFSAFVFIPIAIILIVSTYTDLYKKLIYNWVTFPSLLYFLVYHLIIDFDQMITYILGFFILGGVTLVIALISRSVGGGDIKLFAVLGLAYGMNIGIDIFFFSYLCAVIVAVPILLLGKLFPEKVKIKDLPMAPFMAIGTLTVYYLML